jgi:hypothetical protein
MKNYIVIVILFLFHLHFSNIKKINHKCLFIPYIESVRSKRILLFIIIVVFIFDGNIN